MDKSNQHDSVLPPQGGTELPKVLDDAWKQHLSARQTFVRDLTLACAVLLLLTITFFRAVELIDNIGDLESEKERLILNLNENERDFADRLDEVATNLLDGEERLLALRPNVSCAIRGQYEAGLEAWQKARPGMAGSTALLPRQYALCSSAIGASAFWEWTRSDLDILAKSEFPEEFIWTRVTQKLNRGLRDTKNHEFDQPIEDARVGLQDVVYEQREVLRNKALGGSVTANLMALTWEIQDQQRALNRVDLSITADVSSFGEGAPVPLSTDSDDDIQTRTEALTAWFPEQEQQIHDIIHGSASDPAYSIMGTLAQLEDVMGQAADTLTVASNSELVELQADMDAIRDEYAEPLPGAVTLLPEDATRFFPLILSIVLAYFAWRLLRLNSQGDRLTKAFFGQGLTEDQVHVYYTGPAQVHLSAKESGNIPAIVFGLGAIGIALLPGLFALMTAFANIQSRMLPEENLLDALRKDASSDIAYYMPYGVGALLLVATYWLLGSAALARRHDWGWPQGEQTAGAATALGDASRAEPLQRALHYGTMWMGKHHHQMTYLVILVTATCFFVASAIFVWSQSSALSLRLADPPSEPAKVSVIATETRLPSKRNLEELDASPIDEVRHGVGTLLTVRVELRGLGEQALDLHWYLHDAQAGVDCLNPTLRNQPSEHIVLVPPSGNLEQDYKVWIPDPPTPGSYYATVKLMQGGTVMDEASSDMFRIGPVFQTATDNRAGKTGTDASPAQSAPVTNGVSRGIIETRC